MGNENTRTVEVIRCGTIDLDKEYPGKQVVRLRDLSRLYEGDPLKGLAEAQEAHDTFKRGHTFMAQEYVGPTVEEVMKNPQLASGDPSKHFKQVQKSYNDPVDLQGAIPALSEAVEDLYGRIRGKRLSGINVDVWDQISGAYLGPHNTDVNGTLILPTDREFVEVLQWRLSGGGYSDCFNGEPARGTPGLFFYFPCNEGSGTTIKSFPGVSGQQVTLPANWDWYRYGLLARSAIKVPASALDLELEGADPIGRRGFQFLWYCANARTARTLFTYAGDAFKLAVTSAGKLEATLFDQVSGQGATALQSGKWYLIQINTEMVGGWNPSSTPPAYQYKVTMQVYLGGALEVSVVPPDPLSPSIGSSIPGAANVVTLNGMAADGYDEIRNLNRWVYPAEIANYATFLKNGRVPTKSKGDLGEPGW